MDRTSLKAVCFSLVIVVGICDCFVLDSGSAVYPQNDHLALEQLKLAVEGLANLTRTIEKEVANKNDLTQFLQSDVTMLNATLNLQVAQTRLVDQRIRDLESKVRFLQGTTSETTSDVGTLQQLISILQSDVSSGKQQMTSMSLQNLILNQTIQGQISSLSTNLASIQQSMSNLSTTKPENHLHFTARVPSTSIPTSNVPMKFSQLLQGPSVTGYTTTTGIFRAPWKGAYLFAITLATVSTDYVQCFIVKNRMEFLADVMTAIKGESSVSTQVTVSLLVGDEIAISHCSGAGSIDDYKTSFSGIYLHAE